MSKEPGYYIHVCRTDVDPNNPRMLNHEKQLRISMEREGQFERVLMWCRNSMLDAHSYRTPWEDIFKVSMEPYLCRVAMRDHHVGVGRTGLFRSNIPYCTFKTEVDHFTEW